MKRRHSFNVVWLCALGVVGLGSGCGSSQMGRIDRNRDIYETWPLEVRQAVLDGKVEPGMNADMVQVAWGKPTEVSRSPAGDEVWVYSKGGDPGSVYYPGGAGAGYPGMGYPGGMGGMGGSSIGIMTGRGGTAIGTSTGVGLGGGLGGVGMGGLGATPIVTQPTPPEIREVVFRDGVVVRADKP